MRLRRVLPKEIPSESNSDFSAFSSGFFTEGVVSGFAGDIPLRVLVRPKEELSGEAAGASGATGVSGATEAADTDSGVLSGGAGGGVEAWRGVDSVGFGG